eukprot:TRINITY_DN109705_c0_g1_i1.p1 TRINITY_DN109705_c0_g1~~TRINITY_DN109705_c0_g1_i1.p1  ORF type:complete len:864 (-),score=121.42 TRINITY_DN109705_c0_g1_i1:191-2737(-)
MTFFDWWGFLGTGIQSTFAWAAYNRDGFADNAGWRQNQRYQQKNYNISWIAIARDDIRDMMGISVNRINNYMIVATLILSVAAGSIISVGFDDDCPGYIVFAFYLCTGVSLIFLMLAIMFGVKGQNSAFTNTMKLLTYQVRPENPAEYSHDYMKQAQWIERNGLKGLFRIPGIMPHYNTDTQKDHMKTFGEHVGDLRQGKTTKPYSQLAGKADRRGSKPGGSYADDEYDYNLEDATPLESLVVRSNHTWYLTKFAEFMRLWHPYDMYSKYAMGLGIVCLCHSSTYFTLGYLSVHHYAFSEYSAIVVTLTFLLMGAIIINSNFRSPSIFLRYGTVALITAGPGFSAIAAMTESEVTRQIMVPCSFLAHFLFWIVVFIFANQRAWQEHSMNFVNAGAGFWRKDGKYSKYEKEEVDEDEEEKEEEGDEEQPPQDGLSSHDGLASQDSWKEEQQRLQREWQAHQQSPETIGKTSVRFQEEDDIRGQSACWSQQAQSQLQKRSLQQKKLPESRSASSTSESGKSQSANDNTHWPTDDRQFELRAADTRERIQSTARATILATACLWFLMFLWAVMRYWVISDGGGVSMKVVNNQYAVEATNQPAISWPSPLFRPTLLACAGSSIFASDGFKIYELADAGISATAAVRPVRCPGLEGSVVDLSVSCGMQGCHPVALVHGARYGAAAAVVDCQGSAKPLLQDEVAAERFTVLGMPSNFTQQRLLVGRQGELVEYSWSAEDDGWLPEELVGRINFLNQLGGTDNRKLHKDEGLLALGTLGTTDLMIVRKLSVPRATIEVRDGSTMVPKGQWHYPKNFPAVASACSETAGSLLVLLSSSADAGNGPPRIVRLSLPSA